MSIVIDVGDNGVSQLAMGYTGSTGYIVDRRMANPLYLTETGYDGLTGLGPDRSLIGSIVTSQASNVLCLF